MRLVFRRVFRGCPQSAVSRSQNNGWHRYWETFCQLTLNIEETFFTRSVPVSVPVGVNHDIHEVRIIEGWSGPVERFVGVCPCRRPCLPEVSNDVPPVLFRPTRPCSVLKYHWYHILAARIAGAGSALSMVFWTEYPPMATKPLT